MKNFTLLLIFALSALAGMAQRPTMELSFTAEYAGQYVLLDSIFIENLTHGGDTTLYAPDTLLVLDYVTSIDTREIIEKNTFNVLQNYPNPINKKTEVHLILPVKENIKITVRDILGRELGYYENDLNRGNHTFTFYPGNERYYLLTATGNQTSKTIKMLNANNNTPSGGKCAMVYNGFRDNEIAFKSQEAINSFVFAIGDELRYTGYAKTVNLVNGSDFIEDAPQANENYVFDVTEGIPCPGIPAVTWQGQTYNTVLIGDQCWLKENLNVGEMIPGDDDMENDGTIEKYCFDDDPANCDEYGGLYQWNEMMQYVIQEGTQGICPDGWHIPTDDEWKILEGTVDSQYPVDDPVWNDEGWRGMDAGINLKSTSGWNNNGNGNNLYGFSALPAGARPFNGNFLGQGDSGLWWVSVEFTTYDAWYRLLKFNYIQSARSSYSKDYGLSVRCLRD